MVRERKCGSEGERVRGQAIKRENDKERTRDDEGAYLSEFWVVECEVEWSLFLRVFFVPE
jgi:hypothetical protein